MSKKEKKANRYKKKLAEATYKETTIIPSIAVFYGPSIPDQLLVL